MSPAFLRRLKYYGIGFGFGLVFVFFFFQNRGCAWLPGNRVKNSILDRVLVVSDETASDFKSKGISKEFVLSALNDGEVLFGESDKNNESKVYVIEKDGKKFMFTLPYESFISEVKIAKKASTVKTSKEGIGRIWRLPEDPTLIFPDSSSRVTCQQDVLGLINSKDILKRIKKSGRIDFSRTDLTLRPKPEHYIVFTNDTSTIGAKTIWYKNKLNILSFEIPFKTDCE